jgi:GNAT superfamily N-acetyltransferase
VFVAEDNGGLVGFAITMEVPASLRLAHFWQIRDLFVLPTHRRLGSGDIAEHWRRRVTSRSALDRQYVPLTVRGSTSP